MPVSDGFTSFVISQLNLLPLVTSRSMFGGLGIYSDGLFFALIADDQLYFKVDDTNRSEFEREGMDAFRPYDDDRTMNYWEVPVSVLEDADLLGEWALKSLEISKRTSKKKKRK